LAPEIGAAEGDGVKNFAVAFHGGEVGQGVRAWRLGIGKKEKRFLGANEADLLAHNTVY
jgi:hypothetical protein